MKRSAINAIIRRAEQMAVDNKFFLPPFAAWTPEDWASKSGDYDEIRDNMLGWDITDHGSGAFDKYGLVLFTIRNGNRHGERYPKTYAEKLLILEEGQTCPCHFHWSKMEDIINRGGGTLLIRVHNSMNDGALAETPVTVCVDGHRRTVPAGGVLRLTPGESVTLTPGMYHSFFCEAGGGAVLIGEVSQCNDDKTDNRYLEALGHFPEIEEDEPPYRLLCTEYPAEA